MEILGTRIILVPRDLDASRTFYRDVLELAVAQEWGDDEHPGIAYFTGGSVLELTSNAQSATVGPLSLWFQVRDLDAVHEYLLGQGVTIVRPPRMEEWGLYEMWIDDPDGVRIELSEVPSDHPMRRLPAPVDATLPA